MKRKYLWIKLRLSKKSDEKIVRALVKHLNASAGGLRAARVRRRNAS